jgi:hypothetical protein
VAKSYVYFRLDRKHIYTACVKNKELLKVKTSGRHEVLLSCKYHKLAGLPGVARDEQWRNRKEFFLL